MHSKKSRNKSIFLKICVKQTGESGKIYRYSTSYPQVIHKMWIMLRKPQNQDKLCTVWINKWITKNI